MKGNEINSWDSFTGSGFLKAKDVQFETDEYVVTIATVVEDRGETKLRLNLQRNGKDYEFDVNVTNAKFLESAGIKSPAMLFGKKLYFRKVPANNPKTNAQVEGLRIWKVE